MTTITTSTTTKGTNLIVNGRKVALIIANEKGHKVVAYVLKKAGTDIAVYEKAFQAKNTAKTIRADEVKVCSTYIKTNGKDPCYAILKFRKDIDLDAVQAKLADIATKSGNYPEQEAPAAQEAPEAVEA